MEHATKTRYIAPRVNIREDGEAYTIEAEMPGVSKGGIDVQVKEGELTLSGERAANGHEGGYRLRERPAASYYRAFRLGDTVDTSNITATMNNGLLTLTLAKVPEAKPITVNVN